VYVPDPLDKTVTVCGTAVKPVPPDATGSALVNESVLIVAVPAMLAKPPTHSALAIPTPPAVMIEPVVVLVASVARLELMPCANGIRAVVVVCPSFVIAVDRPVARSAVSALNAELLMTVPVTTGWPEVLIWNVPEPL
jgi:hypothetical protein